MPASVTSRPVWRYTRGPGLTLGAHARAARVCKSVFSATTRAQQGGQKAIPTGSVPHWLDFDFRKSTAFKSYGVKTKRTSQYANEYGLPRPDSARFEHGGGGRSNTKGETLPTDVPSPCVHCFREAVVAASLYRMRISRVHACTCNLYTHELTHA